MGRSVYRMPGLTERAMAASYCVRTLARQTGVSTSTIERRVRERFNVSARAFMLELRMERARQLLLEGRALKEISADLGYSHPQHFSRTFKRYHGCSPTEFMAHNQEVSILIDREMMDIGMKRREKV